MKAHSAGKMDMKSKLNNPFRARIFITRICRKNGQFVSVFLVNFGLLFLSEIIAPVFDRECAVCEK
jgi:hypothetical protein